MADVAQAFGPQNLPIKFVDNGDGTYSISVSGGTGGGGGDASAANQRAQSVKDSAGTVFDPESCSHVYAYSGGNLVTDTATDGAAVRVQTYTYTSGELTGISKWVVQ